jgi:glycosyltransferase involved in cell wall biosynthesis
MARVNNVVIFTPEIPPSYAGGGIHALHFGQYLASMLYNVSITSLNYNWHDRVFSKYSGVQLVKIPYFNRFLITKLISLPVMMCFYSWMVLRNNIIIIYSGHLPAFEWILGVAFLTRKRTVFRSTQYGADDIETLTDHAIPLLRIIRTNLFNKIHVYHAISRRLANRARGIVHARRIVESPQGVNTTEFLPGIDSTLKSKLCIERNTPVILSVGTVINRKNYNMIFHALANLDVSYTYLVAGTTIPNRYRNNSLRKRNEMKKLVTLGKTLLESNITFLGMVNPITPLYQAARIIIHAGIEEGMPNAILEAMACRKIVIVHNKLDAVGWILHPGVNCLSFDTPRELTHIIKEVLSQPDKYQQLAHQAYSDIHSRYSMHVVVQNLFNKLLS